MPNINKPEGLEFDYELYNTVILSDNRFALIMGYGIYDNQYWCEVYYPDGIRLAGANYFSSDPPGTHIVSKTTKADRIKVIQAYIEALKVFCFKYGDDFPERRAALLTTEKLYAEKAGRHR